MDTSKLLELIEDQADIIDALAMKLAIVKGEVEVEIFTAEELDKFIEQTAGESD